MEPHSDPMAETELGESVARARANEGSIPSRELAESVAPGRSVGRYVVLGTLGRGAMGTVFKAYDELLDRAVALKLLHSGTSGRQARRLTREAQALAKLSHPNVVQVYEVGQAGERWFIAMELVQGRTLRQWQEQERDWRACVEVYVQAGAGLVAAHEVGLVHRDFKPDNCIIDERGRVRVLDFGLVREQDGASSTGTSAPQGSGLDDTMAPELTQAGTVVGTPAYMPLEQFEGKSTDERSDQFSFCVALYEAIYGQRPYPGDTVGTLTMALARGDLRAGPRGKGEPAALRRALARGLSREPGERWPSMVALLGELRRVAAPRRRWRWVALVGGGLAALGLGLWVRGSDPVCQGARAQLDGVWDDARRAGVEEAILGTELSYAADTWARVEPALDARADAWVAKHTEVCEATSVRREQSSEVMDLRMACLQRQRNRLREAVDVLAEANESRVERAVVLVADLGSVEACDDVDALRAGLAPPRDATVAAGVEAERERLDRVRSLDLAGEYAQALVLTEAVVVEAERLGHEPLRAEALKEHGVVLQYMGRYSEAEQTLRSAYVVAIESGHDRVMAEVSTVLTALLGNLLARPEEALWWGVPARALAHRLRSSSLEAKAHSSLGSVMAQQGRYDEALQHYRGSFELWGRVPGDRRLEQAQVKSSIGNMLRHQGDYDAALEHHLDALRIQEELLGTMHPELAVTLVNGGTVLFEHGKYDECIDYQRRALKIREAAFGPRHPLVANTLYNLGGSLARTGALDDARTNMRRALSIWEETLGDSHPEVARALEGIAMIDVEQKRFDDVRELQERALAIHTRAQGADHPDLAATHVNLGVICSQQGDYDGALEHYQRALEIREKALGPEHPSLVLLLNNLGGMLDYQGRHEEALPVLERGLALGVEQLGAEHPTVVRIQLSLVVVLVDHGRFDDALGYLQPSLPLFEREDALPDRSRADFYWYLACALEGVGSREQARARMEQSRQLYLSIEGAEDDLQEADAWLRAHPARASGRRSR